MKIINGAPHYLSKEACLEKTYPEIDQALAPLGAAYAPGATIKREDKWWGCGGTVKWPGRPANLRSCNAQSRSIWKALDAATRSLPAERRPQETVLAELQCLAFEAVPDQTMTGNMPTMREKIRELKSIALDPGGDPGSWDDAWTQLRTIDEFRDYFDADEIMISLESGDDRVRLNAVNALGELGDAAVTATAKLKRLMRDPSARVRQRVPHAIGQVNQGLADEVPFLMGLLDHPDPLIGQSAVQGLGAVGPAASDAKPTLEAILNDASRDARWRDAARQALRNMKGRPWEPPAAR